MQQKKSNLQACKSNSTESTLLLIMKSFRIYAHTNTESVYVCVCVYVCILSRRVAVQESPKKPKKQKRKGKYKYENPTMNMKTRKTNRNIWMRTKKRDEEFFEGE